METNRIFPSSQLRLKTKANKDLEDVSNSNHNQFQRLKRTSTALHDWRISHHQGAHPYVDEHDEKFEDEFLQNLDDLNSEGLAEMLFVSESKLNKIKSIELKTDLTYSSLNNAGEILSSLFELKLNNSIMKSLRDIGSTFRQLEVLWVSNCCLKQLAGANSFPNLKELYASYNLIDDVSDLMFETQLTVLDLEGNEIRDIENLHNLSGLQNLTVLSVSANPFASSYPSYKSKVAELLPQVRFIDDEELDSIIKCGSEVPFQKQRELGGEIDDQYEELIQKMERLEVISGSELRESVRDILKKTEIAEPDDEALITMTIKKAP